MMYEGEEFNTIDKLYESPTDFPNGLKVIVPVKYSDRTSFFNKIKEQLAYFEDVYFDVSVRSVYYYNKSFDTISNDFNIIRNRLFQTSELVSNSNLHVCLDNVYYKLDFDRLGVKQIDVPIALRFNLSDGVYPTPNREDIRYTQEAIAVIKERITDVADYIVNKVNSKSQNIDLSTKEGINALVQIKNNNKIRCTIGEKSYEVDNIVNFSRIPLATAKLVGLPNLNIEKLLKDKGNEFLHQYKVKSLIKGGRYTSSIVGGTLKFDELVNHDIYVLNTSITSVKRDYIRNIAIEGSRFVTRNKPIRLFAGWGIMSYTSLLNLKNIHKSKWRDTIKDYQEMIRLIESHFTIVDDVEIPKEWLESRKNSRKKTKYSYTVNIDGQEKTIWENLGITYRSAAQLERFVDGQNCKFVPLTASIEQLRKNKRFTICELHENRAKLDMIYKACKRIRVDLFTLSGREMDKLMSYEFHNFIKYDDFMKGKNKAFKRIITSQLINKLITKFPRTFNDTAVICELSSSLSSDLSLLSEYSRTNYEYLSTETVDAMLSVAEEHNLFDTHVYDVYLRVKSILERLPFIEIILHKFVRDNYRKDTKNATDILRDMLKYHKYRMDYKNYRLPVNKTIKN